MKGNVEIEPITEFQGKPIPPEIIIKNVEDLMEHYSIPKENMVVERSILNYCFLYPTNKD